MAADWIGITDAHYESSCGDTGIHTFEEVDYFIDRLHKAQEFFNF